MKKTPNILEEIGSKDGSMCPKEIQLIQLDVNRKSYLLSVQLEELLLDVLREKLGLKGTKRGCDSGGCGACTVLIDGKAIKSCQIEAYKVQGKKITTIEGLVNDGLLDPLQQSFIEHGAVQCGFCTPGMILAAKSLLNRKPDPNQEDIKKALSGNICRCTGYIKILEAIEAVASRNTYQEEDPVNQLKKI
jgi:aerobic carbon-monoxide dehydrogenase small subunit